MRWVGRVANRNVMTKQPGILKNRGHTAWKRMFKCEISSYRQMV